MGYAVTMKYICAVHFYFNKIINRKGFHIQNSQISLISHTVLPYQAISGIEFCNYSVALLVNALKYEFQATAQHCTQKVNFQFANLDIVTHIICINLNRVAGIKIVLSCIFILYVYIYFLAEFYLPIHAALLFSCLKCFYSVSHSLRIAIFKHG